MSYRQKIAGDYTLLGGGAPCTLH